MLGTFTGFRYGTVLSGSDADDSDDGDIVDNEDMGRLRRWGRTQRDLWLEPKQAAVGRLVDKWWSRWTVLVFFPAALVSDAFGVPDCINMWKC